MHNTHSYNKTIFRGEVRMGQQGGATCGLSIHVCGLWQYILCHLGAAQKEHGLWLQIPKLLQVPAVLGPHSQTAIVAT